MLIRNNRILKSGLSVLLIIALILSGLFIYPKPVQAMMVEKTVTKYHLDMGAQHIWGSGSSVDTATWEKGNNKGGSINVSVSIPFPKGVKNVKVYPYSPSKFKWGDNNYTFNTNNYLKNESDFDNNYKKFVSSSIYNINCSSSGSTVNLSYTATLASSTDFDLKKNLNMGYLDFVLEVLGGKESVQANYPTVYNRLVEGSKGNLASDVYGFMYFTPVIIQYDVTEMVEVADPISGTIDAVLGLPATAKQNESFLAEDLSSLYELTAASAVLRKCNPDGTKQVMGSWNGKGIKNQNTGGKVSITEPNVGTYTYELTLTATDGQVDTDTKQIEITDNRVVGGKAILQLPEYTYEGHSVEAEDCSEFKVDGTNYSAYRAYEEGVASNSFNSIPNIAGQAKKTSETTADVTFSKRGNYNVKLNIDLLSGQTLSDTKPIEVRKTPYVYDRIGGVQKQNRKQLLNFSVATYPDKPIVDYYIEIKDMKAEQTITLTKDKPQENNAFIKTRAHKTSGDKYWTNFDVEFLTKTPGYKEGGDNSGQEFRYTIYVKDSKGDTDSKQKVFTVVPDLPPNPQIIMQDTFIRNKGTNIAEIISEDGTTTDGDQVERTWSAMEYSPIKSSVTGNSPLAGSIEGEYKDIKELPGYTDKSFGSGQKVKYNKTGVGKATVALHVKDVWNEPTLEEYITDTDYLEASTSKNTDVINIAPTVRLEPVDSEMADILILMNKTSASAIRNSINTLRAALIEKGIDANVQLVETAMPDDGPMRATGEWNTNVSLNCPTCTKELVMDSGRGYRAVPFGQVVSGGQDTCVVPHTVEALEPATNGKAQTIAWRYTVNDSNNFSIKLDNEEKYVYLSCVDIGKTIVLNRDNGAYITTLQCALDGTIFLNPVSGSIYAITSAKIQKYQISTGTLSTIYNKGGSLLRIQDGKATFVGQSGTRKFYIGKFDLKEERLDAVEIPEIPTLEWNTGGKTGLAPYDMDSSGKVTFAQGMIDSYNDIIGYTYWMADTKAQTVIQSQRFGGGEIRVVSVGFIKDEKGEGKYLYAATVDDNSDSKKTRVYFSLNIYTLQGALITSYRNETNVIARGVIYAGIDAKTNSAYIVQGSNLNPNYNDWVYGASVKVDLNTFAVTKLYNNTSPLGWNLLDETGYDNDSYMGIYYASDQTTNMPSYIKMLRKPLTAENAAISALNSKANFRTDASKYVVSDTVGAGFEKAMKQKNASRIAFDAKETITIIADKIEDIKKNAKNVLRLIGDSKANLASITKNYTLDPGEDYQYEYDMTLLTGTAIDVFKSSEISQGGTEGAERPYGSDGPYYSKVVAEKDWGNSGDTSFFTDYSSYHLNGAVGLGSGYYGKHNQSENYSCWVKFTMEEAGYVEFDLLRGGYNSSGDLKVYQAVSCDGKTLATYYTNGTFNERKMLLLTAGEHTIDMGGAYSGYIGINNIKVVYTSTKDSSFASANTIGVEMGKIQKIINTFTAPKTASYIRTTKSGNPVIAGSINQYVSYVDTAEYSDTPWSVSQGYAYLGSSARNRAKGYMSITAPYNKALAVSYTESLGGNSMTPPSTSGDVRILNDKIIIIPPGASMQRNYYFAMNGRKTNAGSVFISGMQIAEFPVGSMDAYRIFAPDYFVESSLDAGNSDFHQIVFQGGSYDLISYTNIGGGTKAQGKISLSTVNSSTQFGAHISDFKLRKLAYGIKQDAVSEWLNSAEILAENGWLANTIGNGSAKIADVEPIKKDEEEPLIYKKGQLVAYNIFYDDYENDPSKKQYWKYTHTPMNDGAHPEAAVILNEDGKIVSTGDKLLNASIPRFYVDGKYTVEHWQEDNTRRTSEPKATDGYPLGYPDYNKASNMETVTFYIEGGASAPWVTSIKTLPTLVKEGNAYKIQIGVDDLEKDELRLTTELYKDKKLIYTHKQIGIKANALGVYPETITDNVPTAVGGKYEVVCTVRDGSGAGMGYYKFAVLSDEKITGYVNHTNQWNINRKKYNLNKFEEEVNREISVDDYISSKAPRKRGINIFWSGEKFMLQLAVAGTPNLVTSQIIEYPEYKITMKNTGKKNAAGETIYVADLWNESMINKWGRKVPKKLTFKFTATYAGGLVKTHDVPILVDSQQDYWRLHRYF